VLEKKAELAPRMRAAIERILVSQTYAQDWTIQGQGDAARACLSSAGAERIARNFPIHYDRVQIKREDWSDTEGPAYRYVCTGYATLYDRGVYAEGSYSTRDEFLGKKGGKWRPLEEINEGDIRSAAHHIFCGNAIKELLGLRGLPAAEYQRIMGSTGQDATKSGRVTRGRGTQGGATPEEQAAQRELAEICIGIANDGYVVDEIDGEWQVIARAPDDDRDAMEVAKDICRDLSSFPRENGEIVPGKLAKELRGKWLGATLVKARKLAGK
jgi:hypothetical protein